MIAGGEQQHGHWPRNHLEAASVVVGGLLGLRPLRFIPQSRTDVLLQILLIFFLWGRGPVQQRAGGGLLGGEGLRLVVYLVIFLWYSILAP